jgi:hypothetical protein
MSSCAYVPTAEQHNITVSFLTALYHHSRSQLELFATTQLPALQLACQPPVALLEQAAVQLAP